MWACIYMNTLTAATKENSDTISSPNRLKKHVLSAMFFCIPHIPESKHISRPDYSFRENIRGNLTFLICIFKANTLIHGRILPENFVHQHVGNGNG